MVRGSVAGVGAGGVVVVRAGGGKVGGGVGALSGDNGLGDEGDCECG